MGKRGLLTTVALLVLVSLVGCAAAPDVKQMTVAQATAAIESAGFKVGQVTYDERATGTVGSIVSQSSQEGSVVSLTVAGPAPITVPSLLGLGALKAEQTLMGVALTVGAVTESYDASAPAGTVASQTPAPGVDAAKGSTVALVISKGPTPVPVPLASGKTQTQATALLEAAGFKVKVEEKANTAKKSTVFAQSPTEGLLQPGATVVITVSTGVDLVRVPSFHDFKPSYNGSDWPRVLDSLIAAVEAGFRRVGLVADVEIRSGWGGDKESQSSKAGSMVPRGTTVHIHIPVYD